MPEIPSTPDPTRSILVNLGTSQEAISAINPEPTAIIPGRTLPIHGTPILDYPGVFEKISSLIKTTNKSHKINADIPYASKPENYNKYQGPVAVLILENHESAEHSNPEHRNSKIAIGEALCTDTDLAINNFLYEGPPMRETTEASTKNLVELKADLDTTITHYLIRFAADHKINFRSSENTKEVLEHCILRLLINQIQLASACAARDKDLTEKYQKDMQRMITVTLSTIRGDGNSIKENLDLYHQTLTEAINQFKLGNAITSSIDYATVIEGNYRVALPSLLSPLIISTGRTSEGQALLTPEGLQAWRAILGAQKQILQKRNSTIANSFKQSAGITPMIIGSRHITLVDDLENNGIPTIVIRPSQNMPTINKNVTDFLKSTPA